MSKKEDERQARVQQWWDWQRKAAWEKTRAFEAAIAAPESDFKLAAHRALVNDAIMHFSRVAITGGNYDDAYFIGDGLERAAKLMLVNARLALASHKIELEQERLDRYLSGPSRRLKLRNVARYEELPHAKDDEPSKYLRPGE
jgi:hypothetical protein